MGRRNRGILRTGVRGAGVGVILVVAAVTSACGAQPPDRVEDLTLPSGTTCTLTWWLEPQAGAGAAEEVAEGALAAASITDEDIRAWEARLRAEYVAEFGEPGPQKEAEFERLAPVEVVREQVRDVLASEGFSDSPDRAVEVRGSADCG